MAGVGDEQYERNVRNNKLIINISNISFTLLYENTTRYPILNKAAYKNQPPTAITYICHF